MRKRRGGAARIRFNEDYDRWRRWYDKKKAKDPDYFKRRNGADYAKHRKARLKSASSKERTLWARFAKGKRNARTKGIPWTLSWAKYCWLMFDAKMRCYYCRRALSKAGLCLDRANPAWGYHFVCCGPCNLAKADLFTFWEILAVVAILKKSRGEDIWAGFGTSAATRGRHKK